jgi:hypothetical protein
MNPPDLHTHLYGSLEIDDLRYLASRNRPRWEIYRVSYRKTYRTEPDLANLFATNGDRDRKIRSHYYMLEQGDFARFQTSFDFVIALSSTEPEELFEIVSRVCSRYCSFAEYRMMFPLTLTDSQFEERVQALCEAVSLQNRHYGEPRAKIALSLSRENELLERQYQSLRKLQSISDSVRDELVAVDFCAMEEGYPPLDKVPFIKRLLEENLGDPARALALLYHAGESFADKSVESAVRWVVQAARAGAHRIGHAIALGINPALYTGSVRTETLHERRDHIRFEIENVSSLKDAGYGADESALRGELESYRDRNGEERIRLSYDTQRVGKLNALQNWAMSEVRKSGAVIEICPTSNLRIAGLGAMRNHPVQRFVRAGLNVVVGTDDPGILRTDMGCELSLLQEAGLEPMEIQRMVDNSFSAKSERLSGRIG